MNKEELKHLSKSYPDQKQFFETSDGTVFLNTNSAAAYADTQEDKTIKTHDAVFVEAEEGKTVTAEASKEAVAVKAAEASKEEKTPKAKKPKK